MALPNLPSAMGPLGDAAQQLRDALGQVHEAMKTASTADMPHLTAALKQISDAAEAFGPSLQSIFNLGGKSEALARQLTGMFQAIIDGADKAQAGIAKAIEKEAADRAKQEQAAANQAAKAEANLAKEIQKEEEANRKKQAAREAAQAKQDALDAKEAAKGDKPKKKSTASDVPEAVGLSDALGILKGNLLALDIGAMIAASKSFVEALSPATVQVFNFAVRDLNATIGSALAPAMQVMTGVVREAAGVIAPAMHALAPVISQLAQAFGGVLLQAVQSVVQVLQGLLPVAALSAMFELLTMALNPVYLMFQLLAAVLEPFGDIFNAATSMLGEAFGAIEVVLRAVGETIGEMVGRLFGDLHNKDAMGQMTAAIHGVIRGLILFTAYLAQIAGLKSFKESLIGGLKSASEDHSQDADKAIPLNAHVSSLEQISRDLAIAAATAGAGAGPSKTDNAWLADIAKELNGLSDLDLEAKIKAGVEWAIEAAWAKIKSAASRPVEDVKTIGGGIQSAAASGYAKDGVRGAAGNVFGEIGIALGIGGSSSY